jgi:hypothetical protein
MLKEEKLIEINRLIEEKQAEIDMYDVYQMGLKINL